MKENGITLEKARSRRYPAQTITNADYADDIALRLNTSTQPEFMLHSLEKAAGGIGLHINAEYMCFNHNQSVDISSRKGGSLKLVD